jgi:hypothetical protein
MDKEINVFFQISGALANGIDSRIFIMIINRGIGEKVINGELIIDASRVPNVVPGQKYMG